MARRDHLERAVLDALWDHPDGLTAAELLPLLPGRPLAVTTVLTVLDRLRAKGAADRVRAGRSHRYRAVRTREDAAAAAMLAVLADVDDRSLVFSRFVESVGIRDAEELRAALGRRAEPPDAPAGPPTAVNDGPPTTGGPP